MEDRRSLIRDRVNKLFRDYGPSLQNEQLKKDIVQLIIDLPSKSLDNPSENS